VTALLSPLSNAGLHILHWIYYDVIPCLRLICNSSHANYTTLYCSEIETLTSSCFPVTWAQRSSDSEPERNYLYVNIKTPDVPKADATLSITEKNVTFKGPSKKGVTYSVSLDLFAEIDPENSKANHTDREVELVLRKKELKSEFWPRLLESKQKMHFLKTDFDKVCSNAPRVPNSRF
jgi:hypothetical protein